MTDRFWEEQAETRYAQQPNEMDAASYEMTKERFKRDLEFIRTLNNILRDEQAIETTGTIIHEVSSLRSSNLEIEDD